MKDAEVKEWVAGDESEVTHGSMASGPLSNREVELQVGGHVQITNIYVNLVLIFDIYVFFRQSRTNLYTIYIF